MFIREAAAEEGDFGTTFRSSMSGAIANLDAGLRSLITRLIGSMPTPLTTAFNTTIQNHLIQLEIYC